jgi:NTE family protein
MKVGVALSGGGARGLAHIGVLKALEERGITPDLLAGTSAGALIGALWGLYGYEGSIKRIREGLGSEAFKKIGFGGLKQNKQGFMGTIIQFVKEKYTYAKALSSEAILSGKALEISIKGLVGENSFSDIPFPFYVSALDLVSGVDVIFQSGILWKALYASSAIPGLFPPLKMDNHLLVDGGPTMKIPVEVLLLRGADFIIAVDVGTPLDTSQVDGKALEVMIRADSLATRKLGFLLLSLADIVIKPDLGDMSWLDFENVDFAVEKGYEACERNLKEIKRKKKNIFFRKFYRRKIVSLLRISEEKVFV